MFKGKSSSSVSQRCLLVAGVFTFTTTGAAEVPVSKLYSCINITVNLGKNDHGSVKL